MRYPDKVAVIDGERRVTYAEFDASVNRCAHALADRGLGKGDRLALLLHNCRHYAVLAFATARLGAALVPVNFMLGADEVAYILSHSGASGLVTEDTLAPTAEKAVASAGLAGGIRGWIGLSQAAPTGEWENVDTWIDTGDPFAVEVPVADDDPLRLMYTSGTESRPKGVMLSSRSLIAQYVSCAIDGGMSAEDVEVHALPMYHCAQLDCFFFVDVYLGATSIILPGPDPATLLATIEREKVTKLFCPPTVWIALLRHPDFDSTDLSSLRKGYNGASPMPVESAVRHWRALLSRSPRRSGGKGCRQRRPVPPLTGRTCPLIHSPSPDSRKVTAAAMSAGRPNRGERSMSNTFARYSSGLFVFEFSVSTRPGATTLQRMPSLPHRVAMCLLSATTPDFEEP